MLLKIDFVSLCRVGQHWRGIGVTVGPPRLRRIVDHHRRDYSGIQFWNIHYQYDSSAFDGRHHHRQYNINDERH